MEYIAIAGLVGLAVWVVVKTLLKAADVSANTPEPDLDDEDLI